MAATQTQPSTVVPTPGTYALDPTHSYVAFTARHLMVTKVRGRFPVTEGELVVDADPERSSVHTTIDVCRAESGDGKRGELVRWADLCDPEQHRYATFTSTNVEDHGDGEFVLLVDLTIRVVAR